MNRQNVIKKKKLEKKIKLESIKHFKSARDRLKRLN